MNKVFRVIIGISRLLVEIMLITLFYLTIVSLRVTQHELTHKSLCINYGYPNATITYNDNLLEASGLTVCEGTTRLSAEELKQKRMFDSQLELNENNNLHQLQLLYFVALALLSMVEGKRISEVLSN